MAPANAINRMIDNIAVHMFALDFAYIFYHTRVVVVIMAFRNLLDASLVLNLSSAPDKQNIKPSVNSLYTPTTLFEMWKRPIIDDIINAIVLGVWDKSSDKQEFSKDDITAVFQNIPENTKLNMDTIPRFIRKKIMAKIAEYIFDNFPSASTIQDANKRYLYALILYKISNNMAEKLPVKKVIVTHAPGTANEATTEPYSLMNDTKVNQGYINGFVHNEVITQIQDRVNQNTTTNVDFDTYVNIVKGKQLIKMSNMLNTITTNKFGGDNVYNVFLFYMCILNGIKYLRSTQKQDNTAVEIYDDINNTDVKTNNIKYRVFPVSTGVPIANTLDFSDNKIYETMETILKDYKYMNIKKNMKNFSTKKPRNENMKKIYSEIIKTESDNTRIAYLLEYMKLLKDDMKLEFTILN